RQDVHRLEQDGLALPVVAREHVEARAEFHVDAAQIAKRTNAQRFYRERKHSSQMRIGITTARNCLGPTGRTTAGSSSPPRPSCTSSSSSAPSTSRKYFALKPMVMLGPAYSIGISSNPSPLSGDSVVIRMVPLLSASFTPPVRSLAAMDTARSASAKGARGTRTSFSLCCGMTCE